MTRHYQMSERIHYMPGERGITTVALMRGEEELSRALVVPMVIQLGRARLRMDGIGAVATPEQHRNRGYSRRVLEAAVELMTAGDAVLSTLYGIPSFYPRYGYATLGPEHVIAPVFLGERHELPEGLTVRPGAPTDLPAMQQLYRDETRSACGAIVRDDGWWTWAELERASAAHQDEVRVVEREGRVVGYAARASECWWMRQWERNEPGGLKIAEAFAADLDAGEAVLAACRAWATERGEPSVQLALPPTCRVGAVARFQNTSITERYNESGEFMGRSTGVLALLRGLAPELEARWRPVSCSMPGFSLTIDTDGERATVTGDDGGIQVSAGRSGESEVHLDPGSVARLVLGGYAPEVVLARAGVPRSAWPVMTALFPAQVPYIYPLDRF